MFSRCSSCASPLFYVLYLRRVEKAMVVCKNCGAEYREVTPSGQALVFEAKEIGDA